VLGVVDQTKVAARLVGALSTRKGVLYLLDAFARVRHPRKQLKLIGAVEAGIESLLAARLSESVALMHSVPNADLPWHYSTADS
jgi:hypothetical protein